MFEDPWKDLLPEGEQNEEAAAPTTLLANQEGDATSNDREQEVAASSVDASAGKTDTEAAGMDGQSENSLPSTESCVSSANVGTSGGCTGTGNETGAHVQSQDNGPGMSDSSPSYVEEDSHGAAVMSNAEDTSDKAEDSERPPASSSSQIKDSTSTKVQD